MFKATGQIYAAGVEGNAPPAPMIDVIGEDSERRELSPQARRRLRAVMASLCSVAILSVGLTLITDVRAQQRRDALATKRADALVLAALTVGIGETPAIGRWTMPVQVVTRNGALYELMSLTIEGPWTAAAIVPERPSGVHTVIIELAVSCDTVAMLRVPTSVVVRAKHPGRPVVTTRAALDGAALLDRPRADCRWEGEPVGRSMITRTDLQARICGGWSKRVGGRTNHRSPVGISTRA
jgi:hypothetical protein